MFYIEGGCIIEVDNGVLMLVTIESVLDGNCTKAFVALGTCQGSKCTVNGSHFISRLVVAGGIMVGSEESIDVVVDRHVLVTDGLAYNTEKFKAGEFAVVFIKTMLLVFSLYDVVDMVRIIK